HLTLLVESPRGYANLCRLISASYGTPEGADWQQPSAAGTSRAVSIHEERIPMLDPAVLARHTEGLIALSGCSRGEVPWLVQAGRYREAELAARRYRDWFGARNFLIELQQNLVFGDTARNAALVELAG